VYLCVCVRVRDNTSSDESKQPGFWGRLIGKKAEPAAPLPDLPVPPPPISSRIQTEPPLPVTPIKKKKPPPKGFGRAGTSVGPRPRSFHEKSSSSGGGVDEEAVAIDEVLHKAQMTTKFAKRVAKNALAAAQAAKESEGKNSKSAIISCQASAVTAKTAVSATHHAMLDTKRANVALRRLKGTDIEEEDHSLASDFTTSAIKPHAKNKHRA
jgi:hypothetical protein